MNVWTNRLAGLALALLIGWADQALKYHLLWVTHIRERAVELLPIFRLTYTENYGVSLGLLPASSLEMRWLLIALTGTIATGVFVWILRERRLGDILALGLVLGGAIGNIRDRLGRGYVVDYADLHFGRVDYDLIIGGYRLFGLHSDDYRPFLIFNLADAAITIGVVVLLARSLLTRDKPAPAPVPES